MTHGFEGLAERAREYSPERVAAWTGMTAAEIERLAREYATTQPAALRLNYGVQRTENGGTAVRTIAMLPALTGAWKYRGGGGVLSTSGAFQWDKEAVERPDLALASPLKRLARVVNMCELGKALEMQGSGIREQESVSAEAIDGDKAFPDGPPVKALFVYNSNPGAVAPNQNSVRRGARAFLYRHNGLCGLRFAGDHVPGTHRRAGCVRALLCATQPASHCPPGRGATECVAVCRAGAQDGL
jgi:anaerobic selenocysteine-containing dehydrogenase